MSILQLFGHRGGGAGPGENTLTSIARAFDAGLAGVEIDVRRCASGELVLTHEPVVAGRTVIETGYDQLSPLSVPLLADVLALARGRGRVICEVKNVPWEADFDAPDCATVAGLLPLLTPADDVVVSSFDFCSARAAHSAGLRSAHLTHPGVRPMAGIAFAAENGIDEVHCWVLDVLAEPACVSQAAQAGVSLLAWTAGTQEQLDALQEMGVESVITDLVP